jgi:hypothetical protein
LATKVLTLPAADMRVTTYPGDADPTAVHPADRAQLDIQSADLIQMTAGAAAPRRTPTSRSSARPPAATPSARCS